MSTRQRIILSGLIFLAITTLLGCATIPKGPLQPDEVRLTKARIIETTTVGTRQNYRAVIEYQRGERIKPNDIRLVCTTWYWDTHWGHRFEGPACGRPTTVDDVRIEIQSGVGVIRTYTIEMYVIYLAEGKEKKSNLIRVVHMF